MADSAQKSAYLREDSVATGEYHSRQEQILSFNICRGFTQEEATCLIINYCGTTAQPRALRTEKDVLMPTSGINANYGNQDKNARGGPTHHGSLYMSKKRGQPPTDVYQHP